MNGNTDERVSKLEDRMGATENKVGNLETAFTGLGKMTDERHVTNTKAIAGVNTKLTALIVIGIGTILGAFLTLIITLITK